jgi:NADPH:quinone reductase-like Zn-dependent oxidoreductase
MKAVVAHRYGSPDQVLSVEHIDPPVPGDTDVAVRAHASSVNPADWHLIRGEPRIARLQLGLRRPKEEILGCDVAGTVESVGARVTRFRPGDEVVGITFMRGFAAFAEQVRVPEDCLVAKPAGLSFEQAAVVPLAGLTALQGLRDHGHLSSGQRVLVVGASGGVGTFAVQIAKALGAEVTGVCSGRNVEMVRSLGADHVVDYAQDEFTRGDDRYDLVLQVAGTTSASALRRVLTDDGILVQITGDSPGRWLGPVGRMVRARLLSTVVRQTLTSFTIEPSGDDLLELVKLIEAGEVTPVVHRTWPLAEVADALLFLETGHTPGKVAISHTT